MRLIDAEELGFRILEETSDKDETANKIYGLVINAPTIGPRVVGAEMSLPEPKCAEGCLYGFGSDECEGCLFTTVKPKTGHWHITDAYPHNVYCSECYTRFAQTHWAVWEDGSLPRKFCPNCGAKMEAEE